MAGTTRKLALLIPSSNHWPTLRRIAARIDTAVDFVQTGQIVEVDVATLWPAWLWPVDGEGHGSVADYAAKWI